MPVQFPAVTAPLSSKLGSANKCWKRTKWGGQKEAGP